ncbi:MAG TPA: non-homologous end-joining DNA ligase [Verrucomicrobiae bacterium]|jgi:bifunctional non-homologous end joining protein LigD|nr:non-homologous end-joining DNA ligase [Verrucomicrobiae bacterium]
MAKNIDFPAFEPPMLATLVKTLPDGPEWEYELKLDGYRLEAIKHGDNVRLYSRRGNDFTKKFARIATSVLRIKEHSFITDGEAVAVDKQGRPSFQMLQNRSSMPPGWSLAYYAFDLLQQNGKDLKDLPLRERRSLLEKVVGNSGVLLSQSLPGSLSQIIQAVKLHGLEGVIAKKLDSKYRVGERSKSWLKLPLKPGQDFVIGAYRLDGNRLELLLVGYFENGKLLFAGKVHQGLNPANRRALLKILQPLGIGKCPFKNLPTSTKSHWGEGVTAEEMRDYVWLKPETVAEIKFAEWTKGGVLRHAEFVTLQDDNDPREITRENLV